MTTPLLPNDTILLDFLLSTGYAVQKGERDYYLTMTRQDITVRAATQRGVVMRAIHLESAAIHAAQIMKRAEEQVAEWVL